MRPLSEPFAPVVHAAEVMRGLPAPWFVAGGWAIDLLVGRVTREHEDIEVSILRRNQLELRRHLATWDVRKVVESRLSPWADDERLEPPTHEVHARREDGDLRHLEILFEEASGGLWRFRRDPRIRRRFEDIGRVSPQRIPYLAPEIVLLYKAKGIRPRDEDDFAVTAPLLSPDQRTWLSDALRACHPNHPWIARL